MTIEVRSHRTWYGRRRWRWYWLASSGTTISFSATSYPERRMAWEAAHDYFGRPVRMLHDLGHPDESHIIFAAGREWDSE